MNRTPFYLAAIMLHVAVLFYLAPRDDTAASSAAEKKYVEITLLSAPPSAPVQLQPEQSKSETPNLDPGDPDQVKTAALGPKMDDIAPPVATITAEVTPPPPSPVPIEADTLPSSTPPTIPLLAADVRPLPVGPRTPNTNAPPTTGNGTKPSGAPFSGAGKGGGGNAKEWFLGTGGNGHFYEAIYTPNGISWTDAQRYALLHNGYLATITSAEENAFVFKLIKNPKFWRPSNPEKYSLGPWIGGFKTPFGWEWLNREGPLNYTQWEQHEPDNTSGHQDRLHFYSWRQNDPEPTWDDQQKTTLLWGFVVEYDRDPANLPLNPVAAYSFAEPVGILTQMPPPAPKQGSDSNDPRSR